MLNQVPSPFSLAKSHEIPIFPGEIINLSHGFSCHGFGPQPMRDALRQGAAPHAPCFVPGPHLRWPRPWRSAPARCPAPPELDHSGGIEPGKMVIEPGKMVI